MRAWVLGSFILAAACVAAVGRAGPPPWFPEGGVPLPEDTLSLEITRHDAAIHFAPSASSPRRGSAKLAARMPLLGWAESNGSCTGRWYLIGPQAWICAEVTRLSTWPPGDPKTRAIAQTGLPHDYNFVGPDGSFGYANLRLAEEAIPDSQLEPGFAVALEAVERKPGGEMYGLTTHGLWIPMRDLRPARVTTHQGVEIQDGKLDFGWTYKTGTPVYSKPNRLRRGEKLGKMVRVPILERKKHWGRNWLRIGNERWLRESDLRQPAALGAPDGLRQGERWIQVDTQSQTLIAFQGDQPVFATLVSTGKGPDDSDRATPRGSFRIWVKLVSTDMTNLEDQYASRYYAIEEVPWVMFFERGYGLHGAFWHEDFGNKRSHGCVNLAPKDAHFLFRWAGPTLPEGWHAALPTSYDPGTLVVVR